MSYIFVWFSTWLLYWKKCIYLKTTRLNLFKFTVGINSRYLGHFLEGQSNKRRGRSRTGQQSMDDILSERRLCWLGHVIRMDQRQTLHREVPGFKRGSSRPRTNWRSTLQSTRNSLRMGIIWGEAGVAAQNRSEWRRSPNASTWMRVESRTRWTVKL